MSHLTYVGSSWTEVFASTNCSSTITIKLNDTGEKYARKHKIQKNKKTRLHRNTLTGTLAIRDTGQNSRDKILTLHTAGTKFPSILNTVTDRRRYDTIKC